MVTHLPLTSTGCVLASLSLLGTAVADVDIAPYASVHTVPSACTDGRYLTDGDENTFVSLEPCGDMAGSYVLSFDEPQTVYRLRFLQRGGVHATRIALEAGPLEASLRSVVEREAVLGWNELTFQPPVTAQVFRFRALEGKCGWMGAFPNLFELELGAEQFQGHPPVKGQSPNANLPQLRLGKPIPLLEARKDLSSRLPSYASPPLLKGVWVEAWMVGQPGTEQSRKLLESVRGLGANTVWLWAQAVGTKEPWRVLWRSEVAEGVGNDWLGGFVREAHEHGTKVLVTLYDGSQGGEGAVRFKDERLPVSPSDCTLSGEKYRQDWSRIFAEAVQGGADGVSLCPDEFYHGGHWLAKMTSEDPCHALFRKAYGYERAPAELTDSDQFRKWQLFVYECTGQLLRSYAEAVRRVKPNALTACNISLGAHVCNLRMRLGLAYDVIFERAGIDLPGTDPYAGGEYRSRLDLHPMLFTKLFSAASPTGKCTALLNAGYFVPQKYPRPFPLYSIYGNGLGALFCDARLIVWYRHNYILGDWQGVNLSAAVKRTSAMMDELCALGFERSRTPKRVAVVYSRASEDWWQLKHGGHYTLPNVECIRGYVCHRTVIEWLLRCGYPFDVVYGERKDNVDRLRDYEVVILPFPYAMSDVLLSAVERAVGRGAHLLTFRRSPDSPGECDEFGNQRKEPALKKPFGNRDTKCTLADRDLTRWGMTEDCRAFLCHWLDQALGKGKDWRFDAVGHDVLMLQRETEDGSRFVLLVNYEQKPVTVELGLRTRVRRPQIIVLDSEGAHQGGFDRLPNERALSRFAVTVPAEAVRVIALTNKDKRST